MLGQLIPINALTELEISLYHGHYKTGYFLTLLAYSLQHTQHII